MRIRTLRAAMIAALAAVALSACSSGQDDAADAGPVAFDGAHVGGEAFTEATEAEGVTIIDVRTSGEFAEGHVPGAVNIDVSSPTFADAVAELDADGAYAVYCQSGNRSRVAIDQMASAGLTRTVGLEGGIGAWPGDVATG
ncbi:rhodanese-like domain-containing protein [Demequina muriae]|uniref:Rhodanese-like domain-containing protein n=1 Tax=Demequina muriae TaxID=3051664 RepID=A0ABT8GEN6_9MICO|nr:rhodanese-like domain-containing protein [Demequina sp. EGI L300058]MDN4479894.1 rhodanese-like domain-containing protein [Demequina sp. EGI L300058]